MASFGRQFVCPERPMRTAGVEMEGYDGRETQQTWLKIIRANEKQFTTDAPFQVLLNLAKFHWNWLTKAHPNACYTQAGKTCLIACLFVPNSDGGTFFLSTIPRGIIRDTMEQQGSQMAPIWFNAATNPGLPVGNGQLHAEDAAEWLFEISRFWNGQRQANGHYLPSNAGQIKLAIFGKTEGETEAHPVCPCPGHPFENTGKRPPCAVVAGRLGISLWSNPDMPAPSSGNAGGPGQGPAPGGAGAGQGGGRGGPQGGAGGSGAGTSGGAGPSGSSTAGSGGNTANANQVDALTAQMAKANISGDRPVSRGSTKSTDSTKSSDSSNSTASTSSKSSGNSKNSGTPGSKPCTQTDTPKQTTTDSALPKNPSASSTSASTSSTRVPSGPKAQTANIKPAVKPAAGTKASEKKGGT